MLRGRVLITGGAGFLGRGLIRAADREGWPCGLIVLSRDEQKHVYARRKYPDVQYVIGDILDTGRLALIMQGMDYVIHAAAIKYIPECEQYPSEALRVNVDGTRSVMAAARAAGIKRMVLISTDKAAAPINTYGMTKAICERLVFESADMDEDTRFVGCRYGNVIGSTGSVWHTFKNQAVTDQRLSVTNPAMTRFFIDIDDAVELVVNTLNDAPAGTVVIPQPRSVLMGDLASYLTQRWDLRDFRIAGMRPGEKVHEDMLAENERWRISPFGKWWALAGPTKTSKVCHQESLRGMTSDTAVKMSPSMFYDYANESDQV